MYVSVNGVGYIAPVSQNINYASVANSISTAAAARPKLVQYWAPSVPQGQYAYAVITFTITGADAWQFEPLDPITITIIPTNYTVIGRYQTVNTTFPSIVQVNSITRGLLIVPILSLPFARPPVGGSFLLNIWPSVPNLVSPSSFVIDYNNFDQPMNFTLLAPSMLQEVWMDFTFYETPSPLYIPPKVQQYIPPARVYITVIGVLAVTPPPAIGLYCNEAHTFQITPTGGLPTGWNISVDIMSNIAGTTIVPSELVWNGTSSVPQTFVLTPPPTASLPPGGADLTVSFYQSGDQADPLVVADMPSITFHVKPTTQMLLTGAPIAPMFVGQQKSGITLTPVLGAVTDVTVSVILTPGVAGANVGTATPPTLFFFAGSVNPASFTYYAGSSAGTVTVSFRVNGADAPHFDPILPFVVTINALGVLTLSGLPPMMYTGQSVQGTFVSSITPPQGLSLTISQTGGGTTTPSFMSVPSVVPISFTFLSPSTPGTVTLSFRLSGLDAPVFTVPAPFDITVVSTGTWNIDPLPNTMLSSTVAVFAIGPATVPSAAVQLQISVTSGTLSQSVLSYSPSSYGKLSIIFTSPPAFGIIVTMSFTVTGAGADSLPAPFSSQVRILAGLVVTAKPLLVYAGVDSTPIKVAPALSLDATAFPMQVAVTCLPSCVLTPSLLTLLSSAGTSFTARTSATSGSITISFTSLDINRVSAPAFFSVPISVQSTLITAGPTQVYSYSTATYTVAPATTVAEAFTLTWGLGPGQPGSISPSSIPFAAGTPAGSTKTFVYTAPAQTVPPQMLTLLSNVTTASLGTPAFASPIISLLLKGPQRFAACGNSLAVYISGALTANTISTGIYNAAYAINARPHYQFVASDGSMWHLYYFIDPLTSAGSWVIDVSSGIPSTPSPLALWNADSEAPFSASWRVGGVAATNQLVGTLSVVCAADCSIVGNFTSIEAQVCLGGAMLTGMNSGSPQLQQCSLSCARYLPAVTQQCIGNPLQTVPLAPSLPSLLTQLSTRCGSCNFTYVANVLQVCAATLTASDLAQDLSRVLAFPQNGTDYLCSPACSALFVPFYDGCVASMFTIPITLQRMYATCTPPRPPLAITAMQFIAVTDTTMSVAWPTPTQVQADPLQVTYLLEMNENGAGWVTISSGGIAPSFSLIGLDPSTPYQFRVTGSTDIGSSPVSQVFTQWTNAGPPNAPQSLSNGAITLVASAVPIVSASWSTIVTWTSPTGRSIASGAEANLQYRVIATPLFGTVGVTIAVYYGPLFTAALDGLVPGQRYALSVTCQDSSLNGAGQPTLTRFSNPTTIILNLANAPANVPTISAAVITRSIITVTWTSVGCGRYDCSTSRYELQVATTPQSGVQSSWSSLGSINYPVDGVVTVSMTYSPAVLATTFSFQVRAYNPSFSSAFSVAYQVASAGLPPQTLPTPIYTTPSATSIQVAWTSDPSISAYRFSVVNATSPATSFDVYVATSSLQVNTLGQLVYILPPAVAATRYTISFTGRNKDGWSDTIGVSVISTVTTPPAIPVLLSCVASDPLKENIAFGADDIITLNFDIPTNAPPAVSSPGYLDSLVSFTPNPLPGVYTGSWVSPSSLQIKIIAVSGGPAPVPGITQCKIIGALYNAAATSGPVAVQPAPLVTATLTGLFTGKIDPHFVTVTTTWHVPEDSLPQLVGTTNVPTALWPALNVTITVTAQHGSFSWTNSSLVYPGLTYAMLFSAASPLNMLTYAPAFRYIGPDVIMITLTGDLGVETWTRVLDIYQVNHSPVVIVPSAPPTFDVFQNATKLTGLSFMDEDSSSTSLTTVTLADVASVSALFYFTAPLPVGLGSSATLGQQVSSLTLSGGYSILQAYLNTSVAFLDPNVDTDSLAPIQINVRLNDRGSGLIPSNPLITDAVYLLQPTCAAAPAPVLLGAQLSPDLSLVLLTFDSKLRFVLPPPPAGSTAATNEPCSTFLDSNTVALLGDPTTTQCYLSAQNVLTVQLGLAATIQLHSAITLNPATNAIRRCLTAPVAASAQGSALLTAPPNALYPVVQLTGPNALGVCEDLVIGTTLLQTRGSVVYSWSSSNPELIPDNSATLSGFTILSARMTEGATFTFSVRVTNSLGMTSALVTLSVRKSTQPIPSLVPATLTTLTIATDKPVSLSAAASLPPCLTTLSSSAQLLEFDWTVMPSLPGTSALYVSMAAYPQLQIPANTLTAGATYTFVLVATERAAPALTNSLTFTVITTPPNQNAVVASSTIEAWTSSVITLTTSSAIISSNPGTVVWTCQLLDNSPCVNATSQQYLTPVTSPLTDGVLNLAPGTLAPSAYLFTASPTATPGSISTAITVVVSAAPVPIITLRASSLLIGVSDQLLIASVVATPDGSVYPSNASLTYLWSLGSGSASFDGLRNSLLTVPTGLTASTLSLNFGARYPNVFTRGASLRFRLTVTDAIAGTTGYSEVGVKVSTPPSGGNFQVQPAAGIALNTTFTFSAAGWLGSGALTYKYFYVSTSGSLIPLGSKAGSAVDQDQMFAGQVATSFVVQLVLQVTDPTGLTTTVPSSVIVQPNLVLASDPVADANAIQSRVEALTNSGSVTQLLGLITSQTGQGSTAVPGRCGTTTGASYTLSWSPVATSAGSSSSTAVTSQQAAADLASTQLLVTAINAVIASDPVAAASPSAISACTALMNNVAALSSPSTSAQLITTCTQVLYPNGVVGPQGSLADQLNATLALINLNKPTTGTPVQSPTIGPAASNRRLLGTTSQSSIANVGHLLGSLVDILSKYSRTVLQVPGQIVLLPDCQIPSAVRRDQNSAAFSYKFDIDNTTISFPANWLSTSPTAPNPNIDTQLIYSTTNLYAPPTGGAVLPISGMVITERTTPAGVLLTNTVASPSFIVSMPFTQSLCNSTVCSPLCMIWNPTTSSWNTTGVVTTWPAQLASANGQSKGFADCAVTSNANATVALFVGPPIRQLHSSSSSTGAGGPKSSSTGVAVGSTGAPDPLGPNPGSTGLPDPTQFITAWAVNATLMLNLVPDFISAALKTQLQLDLMTCTGLSAIRVQIRSMAPGSILASFVYLPSTDPKQTTPQEAYQLTLSQLKDNTSLLHRGQVSRYAQNFVVQKYFPAVLCKDGTYQIVCVENGGAMVPANPSSSSTGGDASLLNPNLVGTESTTSTTSQWWFILALVIGGVLVLCTLTTLVYLIVTRKRSEQKAMEKLTTLAATYPALSPRRELRDSVTEDDSPPDASGDTSTPEREESSSGSGPEKSQEKQPVVPIGYGAMSEATPVGVTASSAVAFAGRVQQKKPIKITRGVSMQDVQLHLDTSPSTLVIPTRTSILASPSQSSNPNSPQQAPRQQNLFGDPYDPTFSSPVERQILPPRPQVLVRTVSIPIARPEGLSPASAARAAASASPPPSVGSVPGGRGRVPLGNNSFQARFGARPLASSSQRQPSNNPTERAAQRAAARGQLRATLTREASQLVLGQPLARPEGQLLRPSSSTRPSLYDTAEQENSQVRNTEFDF